MSVTLDMMEYATDINAQLVYETSGRVTLDSMDSLTGWTVAHGSMSLNTTTYYEGSGAINLIKNLTVQSVVYIYRTIPSTDFSDRVIGAWLYIKDSTTLAKVAIASLFVFSSPDDTDYAYYRFYKSPYNISVGWNYLSAHISEFTITGDFDVNAVIKIRADVNANSASDTWLEGDVIYDYYFLDHLYCLSESTIKQQGSYSLKVFGLVTDSLNDTLTRTVDPTIDLTGYSKIKFGVYASRTGSNIKLRIRDSGGTWSEYTIAIGVADAWEAKEWDISGVSDANKDAVDRIEIKIIEASADNIFYLDNMAGWNPTLTLAESIGLLESLPTIERQLTLEESIALKDVSDVPACADIILEEALALAESFPADEQTIVRATATAEFLAEQAKRSNTPAKRIWLYINSTLYDITDKFMSMGPIDRKMAYKPGETKLLTISDQNLVMSNADRYFSDLNPSSPFYNRDYAGADQIKVFAGFIIPETGYAEVLEKADMKLIAIELATKEAKALLRCQDSFRAVFDTYVGMPDSDGVADPLIYTDETFKFIMDDLLENKAGIPAAKVDIEDVDLSFTISFEKKKVADCVEKLSEVARGTTVVLGDGTVKFEQFISESIDPELSLESGKNFSTLQYLGSDSRYRLKKVVVIGQAGVYGESTDTEGIELKIENDAIATGGIAQAMADIYLGKFRIPPAEIELRGEYLPSLDIKSIVEVTEPNSMMSNELLQVKELALDIVGFSTRLTLSVPGRFVGWTNTGGGEHEGGDWIIGEDVEVGGVHTGIGTFKVDSGITATVKAYDGSTYGSFEVHAVDVDVDGDIVASEKGCGGGGAGGGGGGGRYLAGQHGSGGGGGDGIAGGYDGIDGSPGRRIPDEDIGGNGGDGGNGGGGAGTGIKGAGGIGAKGNVGVNHVPATAGGAGSNGGYGSTPNDNDDVSVDVSLLRGKGGGAGGGGGGGDAEIIYPAAASGAGGGGGGAGGYGAGWIKLYATTSIDISGNLTAKGNSGGNGGNGGDGQGGTHPVNLNGGNGGVGGNAVTSGTRSGGSKGTARWSTQNGANGGNGGHGAGGGLLLQCDANAILVSGMLDNRGGGDAAANGGTIKVFYTTGDPTGAGTWHYGRLYKEDIS